MSSETIQPSVEVHISLYKSQRERPSERAAYTYGESIEASFEAMLRSISVRAQEDVNTPITEYMSDEEDITLRGTFWLADYDKTMALTAKQEINNWSTKEDIHVIIIF